MRFAFGLLALALLATGSAWAADAPADRLLFDFEDEADLKSWSALQPPEVKEKEPPVKLELSNEHVTAGKHSLKLTFAGGHWPTISTTRVHDDWVPYQTFHADVTVKRSCVVGFAAFQEKSQRGEGWDALVSRWTRTVFLKPGTNHVVAAIPQPNDYGISAKRGKVVRFEIFMYNPHEGESISVDNIRLTSRKEVPAPATVRFTVAGTDWVLTGSQKDVASADAVRELGKKLKDRWSKPAAQTVAQLEDEFRVQYAELKKKHPRAVLASLRDSEKGYDPAHPDRQYAGWKDAYWNSHGPDANYADRGRNRGKSATHEVFMRHRSPLMQVDLASIPAGSQVLAARLLIVRTSGLKDRDPVKEPTMWVVEPCNRPWEEYDVNAFEYAKDKFWKEIGGFDWAGDDPDFLPTFLAYGPGQPGVNSWDFTEAVRYWTDGKHANHGFMLHGDSYDYMIAHSREASQLKDRPAVLVIYEPK